MSWEEFLLGKIRESGDWSGWGYFGFVFFVDFRVEVFFFIRVYCGSIEICSLRGFRGRKFRFYFIRFVVVVRGGGLD